MLKLPAGIRIVMLFDYPPKIDRCQNISLAEDCQGRYASHMVNPALRLDSITDADAETFGQVVVSGSHGGLYAAAYA